MLKLSLGLSTLCLLGLAQSTSAQVSEAWRRLYDHGTPYSADLARHVAPYPSGGFVVGGSTRSSATQFQFTYPLVLRLDPAGNVLWSRVFGGSPEGGSVNALALTPEGVVVAATSGSASLGVRVLRYDPSGNPTASAGPYAGAYVSARELLLDASGNSYVGCTTTSSLVTTDMVVLSHDASGVQRFATVIPGPAGAGDRLSSLCSDAAGNLFAVGSMDGVQSGASVLAVVKLDASGVHQWTRTHVFAPGGPTQSLGGVVCDAAGNVYAVGFAGTAPSTFQAVVVSYDPNGTFRWLTPLAPGPNTIAQRIAFDPAGSVVVAGTTGSQALCARLDLAGSVLWQQVFAAAGFDGTSWVDLVLTPAGDVAVAGVVGVPGGPFQDLAVAQYAANGQLRWSRTIDHAGQSEQFGAIATGGDGSLALAGWTQPYAPGTGFGPADVLVVDLVRQSQVYCLGDGSGTPCPCANSSPSLEQAGCANSVGAAARLVDQGVASVSADSLALVCSGTTPSATSLLIQAPTATGGTQFGDGLRCVGGSIMRMYTRNASAGVVSYPAAGDPSITARSAAQGDVLVAGGQRAYQVYYRDPNPAFCAPPLGQTWNLSNGILVRFGP